jgi:hypothetical protein
MGVAAADALWWWTWLMEALTGHIALHADGARFIQLKLNKN